jgi:hypothetical protein
MKDKDKLRPKEKATGIIQIDDNPFLPSPVHQARKISWLRGVKENTRYLDNFLRERGFAGILWGGMVAWTPATLREMYEAIHNPQQHPLQRLRGHEHREIGFERRDIDVIVPNNFPLETIVDNPLEKSVDWWMPTKTGYNNGQITMPYSFSGQNLSPGLHVMPNLVSYFYGKDKIQRMNVRRTNFTGEIEFLPNTEWIEGEEIEITPANPYIWLPHNRIEEGFRTWQDLSEVEAYTSGKLKIGLNLFFAGGYKDSHQENLPFWIRHKDYRKFTLEEAGRTIEN